MLTHVTVAGNRAFGGSGGLWQAAGGATVRNSIFAGQCWAAIVNYKGVNNLYDTTGNDYSRLRAGAVPVSNDHDRLLPNCRGAALG